MSEMKNGNGMRKAITSVLMVHPSMTVRTIGALFKQMAGADATASHRNKGFCAARHRLRNTHAELHP